MTAQNPMCKMIAESAVKVYVSKKNMQHAQKQAILNEIVPKREFNEFKEEIKETVATKNEVNELRNDINELKGTLEGSMKETKDMMTTMVTKQQFEEFKNELLEEQLKLVPEIVRCIGEAIDAKIEEENAEIKEFIPPSKELPQIPQIAQSQPQSQQLPQTIEQSIAQDTELTKETKEMKVEEKIEGVPADQQIVPVPVTTTKLETREVLNIAPVPVYASEPIDEPEVDAVLGSRWEVEAAKAHELLTEMIDSAAKWDKSLKPCSFVIQTLDELNVITKYRELAQMANSNIKKQFEETIDNEIKRSKEEKEKMDKIEKAKQEKQEKKNKPKKHFRLFKRKNKNIEDKKVEDKKVEEKVAEKKEDKKVEEKVENKNIEKKV
jgi:hypothetical protein